MRFFGHDAFKVFPTRVGMNLLLRMERELAVRIPHTRGDEPGMRKAADKADEYSPHAWG
ncbi:hypothetical protein DESPIG_00030 [Desulfovibrio piger ATCC 29098]|uniref:Uncharacterized protein n=1 Tax=Desulfovibrio piger ATCC 29098 TaxID=411464 RepID=B6WPR5_9BACT|nr:hypothetical protein DESPIG_00030 [Desulfovibrio piger ATCC 29098]